MSSLFFPTLTFAEKVDTKNAQTQLVLYAIARHADSDDGTCFPSAKRLAKMAKCSEKTVRRHVQHLVKKNIIKVDSQWSENGRQTTSLFTLVGYEKWRADQRSQETSIDPIEEENEGGGQSDHVPEKSMGTGQHVTRGTGQHVTRGTGQQGDQPITNNRTDILTSTPSLTLPLVDRASSLDAWEASPPSPFTPSEGKWVSNQTENPSSPAVNRQTGPTGNIRIVTNAGDAARQVTGASVSTAGWVKVWRVNDEKNFNDWCEWMEANGYMQVVSARTRGFAFVPTPELVDGIEAFKRKFPLAKSAVLSNDALSAKETVG